MQDVPSELENEFYNSTPLKKIVFKILLTQSKNKYGYRFLIEAFVSHVISSTLLLLRSIFTIGTTLFLKTFFLWSRNPTGCISNDKSSLNSTGGVSRTCEGFNMYFLNIKTWKASWICSKSLATRNGKLQVQSF